MSKILTIVVSFNGIAVIDKCIESLLQSDLKTDVILIDNASTDNTASFVINKYPIIKVHQNVSNFGFGRGNNIGFRYAIDQHYDHIFLLNQDAFVFPDTIQNLLISSQSLSNTSVISPLHLDYNGSYLESGCSDFIRDGIDRIWYDHSVNKTYKSLYRINFINAAAWFIPVHIIKKVGGFDPLFFQYGEDNDWINRLLFSEFYLYIDFTSKICHESNYKTWSEISLDPNRLITTYFIDVKNPIASLKSNLFLLLKREIDKATTFLLFFKLRSFFIILKCLFRLLLKLPAIYKSRQVMQIHGAYL